MIKHKMLYVRKVNFAIQAYIGVLIMDNKHKFYKYVDPNKKGILIDTVFVDVIYRGLNIQNKLIKHVVDTYKDEYDYAICTIDPNNTKSVDNFTEEGFTVHKENLKLYGKKNRHMYIKHFK